MSGAGDAGDLDEPTLVKLFWAAVRNADQLCDDAQSLLERGSPGRAMSLAVLALEEYAKASNIAATDLQVRQHGGRLTVSADTVSEWRWHRPKLSTAMIQALGDAPDLLILFGQGSAADASPDDVSPDAIVDLLAKVFTDVTQSAAKANAYKQQGFYVDVADGEVRQPSDVQADQAERVLSAARNLAAVLRADIRLAAEHFGPGPLD